MDYLKDDLERFLYRIAAEIANEAQRQAPTKTRNLRNDIKVYSLGGSRFAVGNSKLAPYAPFVHFGTGLYGPNKRKIMPKKAKALKIPTKQGVIFRKSAKGQKPNPYLERALENYLKGDINRAISELQHELLKKTAQELKEKLKNVKVEIKS